MFLLPAVFRTARRAAGTFSLAAALIGPVGHAQPTVNSILNAASYSVPGMPNSAIAQGSMFIVFGKAMGPAALQQAQTFPYPTQLGGTSIHVTGGGVTADAVMIYTSAGQIAGILPSRVHAGDATLTVTYNSQTSSPLAFKVAGSMFGILTRNQGGSGPAIVQNYDSAAEQPLNTLTEAAHPGQVLILWGTGLGPVDFDETRPPVVRNLDVDVQVLVGGKSAPLLYKGRSSQFPGIDQVNFQLPDDVATGCYVPLTIRTGTAMSNFATISIAASGNVCSDAHGFSAADLTTLRSTGQLRRGEIKLAKMIVLNVAPSVYDEADADFSRYTQQGLTQLTRVGAYVLPFGTCTVVASAVDKSDPLNLTENPGSVARVDLNAGVSLNLTGPRGSKQLPAGKGYGGGLGGGIPGFTDQFGPEYLVTGAYTVDNGTGGANVGAFRATFTLPSPVTWTGNDGISTVRRSQPLTVTWTGGDSSREYVLIQGLSSDTGFGGGAMFSCVERASAGQFTVPTSVLSLLPASGTTGTGAQAMPTGTLAVISESMTDPFRFQAQGLDVGIFGYVMSNFRIVAYQ